MRRHTIAFLSVTVVLAAAACGNGDAGDPAAGGDAGRKARAGDGVGPEWLLPKSPLANRFDHLLVWTGGSVIAWGRSDTAQWFDDGAEFDLTARTWRRLPSGPLSSMGRPRGVWAGKEVLIWGGATSGGLTATGAGYSPVERKWRLLAPSPLQARSGHALAWTGNELFVWGGERGRPGHEPLGDGALYNPSTDTWRPVPPAPISARAGAAAIAVGDDVVVFGGWTTSPPAGEGSDPTKRHQADGAVFSSSTGQWTTLPETPELVATPHGCATADGEVFILGAEPPPEPDELSPQTAIGLILDPSRETWRVLPDPRRDRIIDGETHRAAGFGGVLFCDGDDVLLGSLLYVSRLDRATGTWRVTVEPPFLMNRAVFAGTGLFAFEVQSPARPASPGHFLPSDTAWVPL